MESHLRNYPIYLKCFMMSDKESVYDNYKEKKELEEAAKRLFG